MTKRQIKNKAIALKPNGLEISHFTTEKKDKTRENFSVYSTINSYFIVEGFIFNISSPHKILKATTDYLNVVDFLIENSN